MKAALAAGPGVALTVEDVELGDLAPNEVLVRVQASGICHSDLNPLGGLSAAPGWPLVLGHEGVGVVEDVGRSVSTLARGDRVIASFVPSCGLCPWCVRGEAHLCKDLGKQVRTPLHRHDGSDVYVWSDLGTFAEAVIAPERALIRVESELPADQLSLIACGVTTGVGAVFNAAAVQPGDSVAVIGLGGVGQSAIQGARIAGASTIIAVDPVPLKREVALRLGATHAIDPQAGDPTGEVRSLTGGQGVDHALETAGRGDTANQAYGFARRGGSVVLVGAPPKDAKPSWGLFDQMYNSKKVIGALYGASQPRRDFPRMIRLAESGLLDLASMVSRRLSLSEVNEGISALERGEVVRAVIVL